MKLLSYLFLGLILLACQNKPSLQKYMAIHSDSPDFIALDLTPAMLVSDKEKLSDEDQKLLESFKKLNLLFFKKSDTNTETYKVEKETLLNILKESSQYEKIFYTSSREQGISLYVLGASDKIQEAVLYGYQNDLGFVVARFMGKDMDVNKLMHLTSFIGSSEATTKQIEPFLKMISSQPED